MGLYDDILSGTAKPAATTSGAYDDILHGNSTVAEETLKAPARVLGDVAETAGRAAQYFSGGNVGLGLRNFGKGLQERNAMTPGFVQEHPVLSEAGSAAEGVAAMAPYMVAGLAAPVVPAAVLPAVLGGAEGQKAKEEALARGMTDKEAFNASLLPAAATGIGMAAMGPAVRGVRGLLPKAMEANVARAVGKSLMKSILPDVAAGTAAGTAVMQAQGAATAEAERVSGARPEADPIKEIIANPKAWLSAALTGGMFEAASLPGKLAAGEAVKQILNDPSQPKAVKAQIILAQAKEMAKTHPGEAASYRKDELAKLHTGEPLDTTATDLLFKGEEKAPSEQETKEGLLGALSASLETGEAPLDELHEQQVKTSLEGVQKRLDAHTDEALEAVKTPEERADELISRGQLSIRRGEGLNPAIEEALTARGKMLVNQGLETTGSIVRHRFTIEDIPQDALQMVNPETGEVESVPRSQLTLATQKGYRFPGEEDYAQYESGTGEVDGSGGAQSGVREEGGNPAEGGEGLQQSGYRDGNTEEAQRAAEEIGGSHVEATGRVAEEAAGTRPDQVKELGGQHEGNGAVPAGRRPKEPKPFKTQADVETEKVAKLLKKGPEAVLEERRQRERVPDPQTGFIAKEHHAPTLERAWKEHKKSKRPFAYADIDVTNLGGLNKHAGSNAEADLHLRGMADVISAEIKKDHPSAQIFRKGGDEFGVLAPDTTAEELKATLTRAKESVGRYAKENGLHEVPHTKVGQPEGVGIKFGVSDFAGHKTVLDAVTTADRGTARSKEMASAIKDGEQRLAYEDNPNIVVARKGDLIALIDQRGKGELLGLAEISKGKLGDWVNEPATVDERVAAERVFRQNLGEESRLNRGTGTGVAQRDVKEHLRDITAGLKITVVVVAHEGEVPGFKNEGVDTWNGLFHKGKIYLNAENLSSVKEAEEVLLKHEIIHAGLRDLLGSKFTSLIGRAWSDRGTEIREFADSKGIDWKSKEGKAEATEEYIVSLAKGAEKSPVWDKFVATFKDFLRGLGFKLRLSDAELRSLVSRAGEAMKRGAEALAGGTRFNADGKPVAWFSALEKLIDSKTSTLKGDTKVPASHFESLLKDAKKDELEQSGFKEFLKEHPRVAKNEVMDFLRENQLELKDVVLGEEPSTGWIPVERTEAEQWRNNGEITEEEYQKLLENGGFEGATGPYPPATKFDNPNLQEPEGLSRAPMMSVTQETPASFARFSRVSSDNPEESKKGIAEWGSVVTRITKDIGRKAWHFIMPFDRTITMGASRADFAPIRGNLRDIMDYAKQKGAAANKDDHATRMTTAAILKVPESLRNDFHLASLYEVTLSKPLDSQWTPESWEKGGMQERTGLSWPQAKKRLTSLKDRLDADPEAKKAYDTIVKDCANQYAAVREATEESIKAKMDTLYGVGTMEKARGVLEEYRKALADKNVLEAFRAKHGDAITDTAAALQAVDAKFPTLKGDYMPLFRHEGAYTVRAYEAGESGRQVLMRTMNSKQEAMNLAQEWQRPDWRVEDINGNEIRKGFKSVTEAQRFADTNPDYVVKNPTDARAEVSEPYDPKQVSIPPDVIARIQQKAGERFKGQDLEDFQKDISSIFEAASTSPTSLKANKLHREGIPGFEKDPAIAYVAYVKRAQRMVASTLYDAKIAQSLLQMENTTKSLPQRTQEQINSNLDMQHFVNLVNKQFKSQATEQVPGWLRNVSNGTALWYLMSPRMFFVMHAHPFVKTLPAMASRFGTAAYTRYFSEMGRYMAGKYSDEKIQEFAEKNQIDFEGRKISVPEYLAKLVEKAREADTAGQQSEVAKLSKEMEETYDKFSPEEQKLLTLKYHQIQGAESIGLSYILQDMIAGASDGQKLFNKITDLGLKHVRYSDEGTRRVSAIASFDMMMERTGGDFYKAQEWSRQIINDTLMDFSRQNRSPMMQGSLGRMMFQFQFFRFHTLGKVVQLSMDAYGQQYREALKTATTEEQKAAIRTELAEKRKELAYMVGTTWALAGAAGTPLALLASNTLTNALWDAMAFLFEDKDNPWNPKADFEHMLEGSIGETPTNVLMKGLPALINWDAARMGGVGSMGHVLEAEMPPGLHGQKKAEWYAQHLLGPTWGMVTDGFKTIEDVQNGDIGKALKDSSPKLIKDFYKAYGLQDEGIKALNGRTIMQPSEVSPWSIVLMMNGINPMEVTLAQEEAREVSNLSTVLTQRRSHLISSFTKAQASGDYDGREEALSAISTWGQKHPKLAISQSELASAVKRGIEKSSGKLTKKEKIVEEMVKEGT